MQPDLEVWKNVQGIIKYKISIHPNFILKPGHIERSPPVLCFSVSFVEIKENYILKI
jgi:hypothetical protein